jgi:hypothetical protein
VVFGPTVDEPPPVTEANEVQRPYVHDHLEPVELFVGWLDVHLRVDVYPRGPTRSVTTETRRAARRVAGDESMAPGCPSCPADLAVAPSAYVYRQMLNTARVPTGGLGARPASAARVVIVHAGKLGATPSPAWQPGRPPGNDACLAILVVERLA